MLKHLLIPLFVNNIYFMWTVDTLWTVKYKAWLKFNNCENVKHYTCEPFWQKSKTLKAWNKRQLFFIFVDKRYKRHAQESLHHELCFSFPRSRSQGQRGNEDKFWHPLKSLCWKMKIEFFLWVSNLKFNGLPSEVFLSSLRCRSRPVYWVLILWWVLFIFVYFGFG
jgi:hypothetical protein